MPSSNKFPSGLNKYLEDDVMKMTDVNNDNAIIDGFIETEGGAGALAKSYTLNPASWIQQPTGEYRYTIAGDDFFAAEGYMYMMSAAPAELLAVAALGGIYLYGIPADGNVVLMCPKKPQTEINATITRQALVAERGA